jgi:hypothetical protein
MHILNTSIDLAFCAGWILIIVSRTRIDLRALKQGRMTSYLFSPTKYFAFMRENWIEVRAPFISSLVGAAIVFISLVLAIAGVWEPFVILR